ncbi:Barstar Ribonuclease inhibitor [Paenibacillus sp. FSL R5-192]|uniref:barstar family protein n=1 Tax=Paenibacillus sp. FSL R5-192 TaxID=1226754 RepID=UPI0003E1E111|nr:barstar family protein [Paenibacillus sp. FSL R5-192]ETT37223.1 Barstar Ribonuclease inhibitor [Paenibacillus sp. FSL R5-192]
MNTVILDGEDLASSTELHQQLKVKLKLPDFYGGNLDALWDCLTGTIELPLELKWTNYQISEERLGNEANRVRDLMLEVQAEQAGFQLLVEK